MERIHEPRTWPRRSTSAGALTRELRRSPARVPGDACSEAWLIGSLAGHIENAVDQVGPRPEGTHEVLALFERGPGTRRWRGSEAKDFLRRAEARDREGMLETVAAARAWACCRHDPLLPGRRSRTWATRPPCSSAAVDRGCSPPEVRGRGHGHHRGFTPTEQLRTRPGHRDLGREVAAAGLVVVSGMAMGIDARAARRCAGGRRSDARRSGVRSRLPVPATPPAALRGDRRAWPHDRRASAGHPGEALDVSGQDRIMAALGRMTVVVEARERSGP